MTRTQSWGRRGAAFLTSLACLVGGEALALGTLVGPDGTETVTAARAVLARGVDTVQLAVQIEYTGAPTTALWLVALPNFNDPPADGVRSGHFDPAAFDVLDAASAPTFTGVCDGAPNGEGPLTSAPAFGPGPSAALPTRFFSARDLENGDLATYAGTIGVTLDDAANAAIDDMLERNYMFAAVRIDTAALGVARLSPVVSLEWPRAAGEEARVAYRPLGASAMATAPVTLYTLGDGRMRPSNLNARELDFTDVAFSNSSSTNYDATVDSTVMTQQTRQLITEFAGNVDGGGNADLQSAIDGSGPYLTRLYARMSPLALQAMPGVFSMAVQGPSDYSNVHEITGSDCGGEEPDMGVVAEDDMGVAADDAAIADDAATDSDGGTSGDSGGGGGGGCSVASAADPVGLLALLGGIFALGFGLRRRR